MGIEISVLTETWNNSGTTFNGICKDVTATAYAAGSRLINLKVGGSSKFDVDVSGNATLAGTLTLGGHNVVSGTSNKGELRLNQGSGTFAAAAFGGAESLQWTASQVNVNGGMRLGTSPYVFLSCDATNVLAQRNSTTAQTTRVYTTYTNSSNYERLGLNTAAGSVELAAESAGTGSADIDVKLTPKGTGAVRFGTHSAIAAETVTGYITIKDASGTTRKVAVVS